MSRAALPTTMGFLMLLLIAAACSSTTPDAGSSIRPSVAPSSVTVTSTAASLPPNPQTTLVPTESSTTTTVSSRFIEPPEFDTWAAILASLPVDEFDRTAAEAHALELPMPRLGVVLSDDYPSLRTGYWVVFGPTTSEWWEAGRTCERVGDQIPDCYTGYFGVDRARVFNHADGHLLGLSEAGMLVLVDFTTGEIVRTIGGFGGDGRYPGEPQLDANTWAVYQSVSVEDSWFSCESSDGSIVRIDLETGSSDEIASGTSPALSPDGARLAYLAASDCVDDPAQAGWVYTWFDTIVVRDLTNGRETRSTVPLAEGADGVPLELMSVTWGSNSDEVLVVDQSGSVRRFSVGSSNGVEVATLGGSNSWRLVGIDGATGHVLVEERSWENGEAQTTFGWLDLTDGSIEPFMTGGHASAAFDQAGEILGIVIGSILHLGGREFPLDVGVISFDW